LRPVAVNTWLRALNAYCRWLRDESVIRDAVKLAPLKVERRLVRTLDEKSIRAVLGFRPRTYAHWRVQVMACTILDTGCRIDELLRARARDFDFDNRNQPSSPPLSLCRFMKMTTAPTMRPQTARNTAIVIGRQFNMI
jgi:integrase